MKHPNLILAGLVNAMGVAIYIVAVTLIMQSGEKIFGKMDNFLGPVAFLLLFVLSATITGTLVLGRPIYLYMEGRKAEAPKLFFYTVGWLLLLTIIVFIGQILG